MKSKSDYRAAQKYIKNYIKRHSKKRLLTMSDEVGAYSGYTAGETVTDKKCVQVGYKKHHRRGSVKDKGKSMRKKHKRADLYCGYKMKMVHCDEHETKFIWSFYTDSCRLPCNKVYGTLDVTFWTGKHDRDPNYVHPDYSIFYRGIGVSLLHFPSKEEIFIYVLGIDGLEIAVSEVIGGSECLRHCFKDNYAKPKLDE